MSYKFYQVRADLALKVPNGVYWLLTLIDGYLDAYPEKDKTWLSNRLAGWWYHFTEKYGRLGPDGNWIDERSQQ